jgi:5-methylcytosine-specific restriction endonuclease McrA
MPSSPTSICRDCSSRAVNNGYCDQHQVNNERRLRKSMFDDYRADDKVRALYRCKRWQITRMKVLRRDVLCQSCKHQAATDVHHILNARLILDNYGTDAFYDIDRLMALCKACHSSTTAHECGWTGKTETKITTFGNRSNLTIVCGSDKTTTYVSTHKADDDLTWDYDAVMHEITGLPLHEGLQGAIGSVLAHRDQWLASTQYSKRHCWLIVSNPKAVIVEALQQAGAQVITMTTDEDECNASIVTQ